MKEEEDGPPNRELYALLHISPDASDEEVRKSYRQWAQIYHPDKIQAPHMKDAATENFQRYVKLMRYCQMRIKGRYMTFMEQQKVSAHFLPSGTILANMSLPHFLHGQGFMRGMAMTSSVQSQISKRNTLSIGGNVAVNGNTGGGGDCCFCASAFSSFFHRFVGSTGLRALLGVQTSRHLSQHLTATMGLALSLRDGSLNLSNMWTRQLSETASGNIELALGSDSSIAVGWQKKEHKSSASGQLKVGISSFEASANYTHRFSKKSHGHLEGKIGSHALVIEVGGGRKLSKFSAVRMLYSIGIQGIFWKLELHRGGQKLIIPILLSRHLNPVFATGAFLVPTSLYFLAKETDDRCYVGGVLKMIEIHLQPYYLKREKQKALENMERTSAKVQEARAAAEKAKQLLQNVANRKQKRQQEIGGLVITKALYGSVKALKKRDEPVESNDDLASQFIDVALPLNFLVSDDGQLKLHEGVKKSGIMGFCDPCPGEPKQLYVEYTYGGNRYEVVVHDYAELLIPREEHRI
ncbi:hypothetical protein M0R45_024737 [Rubus argutus]|uniref:J domain-containing protein n=1 Tax=Rubus argutus TaxID=59490 RepID=A0AAW1WSL2_RUBAR